MDLDHFIIATFCLVGTTSWLTSLAIDVGEVLTMEIVGKCLSLHQDKALFDYFRRHYSHFFPALRQRQRTTFVRQTANLCHLKERMWQRLLPRIGCESWLQLVDSFPLPVCQFARAHR